MIQTTRRAFLAGLPAAAIGFAGFRSLWSSAARGQPMITGHGPLLPDPARLLDLPRGFNYRIVSRAGQRMDDGLLTPAAFDGMACFPVAGRPHRVALVRNHEIWPDDTAGGAFGPDHALVRRIPRDRLFDFAPDGAPKLGGTTTLVWDMRSRRVVRSHLSLAGTCGNCAGGPTPWGSWLSCEETIEQGPPTVSRAHGFVFEVPASERGLVDPVPLADMGRFVHEAAAVDPVTGIVYMTEDRPDGLFYRFLPEARGELRRGGRLQALALREDPARDLRNWPDGGAAIAVGESVAARWIDLDGVESPQGDLKDRGHARGALRFARGEGIAVGAGANGVEIYMACTMGGPLRIGQVWRYRPGPAEGRSDEAATPGALDLFVETTDPARLGYCDNVAVAPWGGLILCEDGPAERAQHLRGVTPDGRLYPIAANRYSEFAGACFSPDGSTMFVNAQTPGITFAITGPWREIDARPVEA